MRWIIVLVLGLCLAGCSGTQKTDWTGLAAQAVPTFRSGKCGPELVWTKEVEAYADVEVVGELTVRRKCLPEQ